jgi:hypothetical protein
MASRPRGTNRRMDSSLEANGVVLTYAPRKE